MPRAALILTLAALALTGCNASSTDGGLRIETPPDEPCPHPSALAAAYVGEPAEILTARLGDELLVCEGRRAALNDALTGVRNALN